MATQTMERAQSTVRSVTQRAKGVLGNASHEQIANGLGWLSIALGLIALAGPLVFLVFVATAPWAIIVSVLLYRYNGDPAPSQSTLIVP